MPFREAFGIPESQSIVLSDVTLRSAAIIFSEFEGAKFNIDTMEFEETKP